MPNNRNRLTISFIDQLQPAVNDRDVWDTDVPGLKVKVTPTGRKVFVVQHRTRSRVQRKLSRAETAAQSISIAVSSSDERFGAS